MLQRVPPPPYIHPPSLPASTSSLDAEQTQCSVCEITRLINANKQTTVQRQPQMKANLYLIDKRRSSFNLPVCPARCRSTPPSFTSTHLLHPSLPPSRSLSQPLPCCWAGLRGRENRLTHRLFIDQPLFYPSSYVLCFLRIFLCSIGSVYWAGEPSQRRNRGWSFRVISSEKGRRLLISFSCCP